MLEQQSRKVCKEKGWEICVATSKGLCHTAAVSNVQLITPMLDMQCGLNPHHGNICWAACTFGCALFSERVKNALVLLPTH